MHRFRGTEGARVTTQLPWGLPLEVDMGEAVGFSIAAGRVFDPCVTEALYRLITPGDAFADVGANVGYITSLAAVRVGPEGRVMAFEPHPGVFGILESNVGLWRDGSAIGSVVARRLALSDQAGEGTLISGPSFEANMGTSALDSETSAEPGATTFNVPLARLDDVAGDEPLGVLKIDVEGHEAAVLRGATRLLGSGGIRDIVFEDHDGYPSEATAIVEDAGYELISLDNDLRGLRLVAPADRGEVPAWPGPSYLATREPDRARARLGRRGWQVKGIGLGGSARAGRA
jgi:FkbM family methyltransferase